MQKNIFETLGIFTLVLLVMSMTGAASACSPHGHNQMYGHNHRWNSLSDNGQSGNDGSCSCGNDGSHNCNNDGSSNTGSDGSCNFGNEDSNNLSDNDQSCNDGSCSNGGNVGSNSLSAVSYTHLTLPTKR